MRAALLLSLMFCACGNWSNEDVEYLYALPQKEALKSQLSDTASTGQGLRHDPLIGDPVKYYAEAEANSAAFNALVENVLGGLDVLRTIAPTTREPNKRIWGPWPDDKNPGFDGRAEITKTGDKTYEWKVQARKRGTQTFTTIIGGQFVATETLRKGRGTFFFDAVAAHGVYGTTKAKPEDPDKVDFGYATDGDPVIVEIDVKVPQLTVPVRYQLNRYADAAGVFGFTADGLPDPNATKISAIYSWNAQRAGRIVYTVLAGNYAGAMAEQCWNTDQKVVFEFGNWAGGPNAGNRSDCAEVAAYKDLPAFPP
ncbi:MAG: hypothetical protein JNK82_07500 [Myxococcaceae bacterium]|nr:hypothetical protein [Myxococcaceae bacterium]